MLSSFFSERYLLSKMESAEANDMSHSDSDFETYEMRDNKRNVLCKVLIRIFELVFNPGAFPTNSLTSAHCNSSFYLIPPRGYPTTNIKFPNQNKRNTHENTSPLLEG